MPITSEVTDADLYRAAKKKFPGVQRIALASWATSDTPGEREWKLSISYNVGKHNREWKTVATAGNLAELMLMLRAMTGVSRGIGVYDG